MFAMIFYSHFQIILTRMFCIGWNSSWTYDVTPFTSLWRVCEEMMNRDSGARNNYRLACTEVKCVNFSQKNKM